MVIGSFSIVHLRIKLSQMRIGVDLDGVVANFTKGWTEYYEEEFGKKIQEDEIITISCPDLESSLSVSTEFS